MRDKKKLDTRSRGIAVLLAVVILLFGARLCDIQLVNAEKYSSEANKKYTRTTAIKAARGEILDCYGRPLAVNREGYNIVFNGAYIEASASNPIIHQLISMLSAAGKEWNDDLPLSSSAPYNFTDDETAVSILRSKIGLTHYATAQNCFDEMLNRYSLEGFDPALQRQIMGVRYSMEKADYSISYPYTFAEDISTELMTAILESSLGNTGVEINVVPIREYVDGTVAPHIIGTVGKITAEEWESTYKNKNYSYDDKVGVFGIEKEYEEYLHGVDGVVTYTLDNNGNILSSEITRQPVQGNTLILSLDKRLQITAQEKLEAMVRETNAKGGKITGASAVAVNVKTGKILIAATYPSYDINNYFTGYSALYAQGNDGPLLNRAFRGCYQPGSCFKPSVALAALQTGAITADERINCTRVYTRFSDYTPSCMGRHGYVNVISALSQSCNFFFYETGYRTGIETMNKYCRLLGLGEKTGVEAAVGEESGTLAGPELSESRGQLWTDGNVIQAAIGQHDNAFTPLQLAVYASTIANGGTRYKTSLLNEVKSYSLENTVYVKEPEVAAETGLSPSVINIVKEGMLSVTEEGTARGYFADYPIKLGGKTGTAENTGDDHSLFVVFGPYENPEIAVAVVFEHGRNSSTTGPVTKSILDEYFFNSTAVSAETQVNTLLR